MEQFYEYRGRCYRRLAEAGGMVWLACCDRLCAPICADAAFCVPVEIPDFFLDESEPSAKCRETMRRRKEILRPLLDDADCVADSGKRRRAIQSCAREGGVSEKTAARWYYAYLAYGERGLVPKGHVGRQMDPKTERSIRSALNRFYYSPRQGNSI